MVKILVVDDEEQFRRTVRAVVAGDHRLEVCGEAVSAEEALALAERARPDVVLLDDHLFGGLRGSDVVTQVREAAGGAPVLLMSASHRGLDAGHGADAVLEKSAVDRLLGVIRGLAGLEPAEDQD